MDRFAWAKYAFPLFLLLAVVIRWGTFFPSVLDHDETTYFLIGKGLLEGQTYLVDTIDTKPIGIFLIYAFFAWLGSGTLWVARLGAALAVGLSGWLLYRLGRQQTRSTAVGWGAGISYVLLVSIFSRYGVSPNTELFFVPFTVGAFVLALRSNVGVLHFTGAGLLLGLAFVIKYVVAADAFALGVYLLYLGWKNGHLSRTIFRQCLPMTVVFFLPLVATYGWYASHGLGETFWFYTFEVAGRYPTDTPWSERWFFLGKFFGRFLPFTVFAVLAFRDRVDVRASWPVFLLFWLVCTTIMTLVPGTLFGHYQIQMMVPLALLAGRWFHAARPSGRWKRPRLAFWRGLVLFVTLGLSIGLYLANNRKPDVPRLVAAELQTRMQPGQQLYSGNCQHVLYHLLAQAPPTPYVHSSLLFFPHHIENLGIDLDAETDRILHQERVDFALLCWDYPRNALTDAIEREFVLVDTLQSGYYLWQRVTKTD
ncbi:MAG: glycosyltransferase family 39 protein [Bacteroidota bacterium]